MLEEIEGLIPIYNIEPYYKVALKNAKDSPCTRRKYGAVIAFTDSAVMTIGINARVTRCCDEFCVRTRYGVVNGARSDLGAEVHAEQAALIDAPKKGKAFVLAGWQVQNGFELTELKGRAVYPCLSCARMIKYAGYLYVYMKDDNNLISPVSINTVIRERELEIGPHYE